MRLNPECLTWGKFYATTTNTNLGLLLRTRSKLISWTVRYKWRYTPVIVIPLKNPRLTPNSNSKYLTWEKLQITAVDINLGVIWEESLTDTCNRCDVQWFPRIEMHVKQWTWARVVKHTSASWSQLCNGYASGTQSAKRDKAVMMVNWRSSCFPWRAAAHRKSPRKLTRDVLDRAITPRFEDQSCKSPYLANQYAKLSLIAWRAGGMCVRVAQDALHIATTCRK